MTPDGTIAGYYCNTAACAQQFALVGAHGFLRDRNGSFKSFDPPSSTNTYVATISTNGEIAGAYSNTTGTYGFVRGRDEPSQPSLRPAPQANIRPNI